MGRARLPRPARRQMILLDTQTVIWFFNGNDRLGPQARQAIETARRSRTALVAPILFWEVAMLNRRGRITLTLPVNDWTAMVLKACELAGLTPEIAIDAGGLGGDVHGDPMDRMMIATARERRCPLMTSDRKILGYAKAGLLQAIDARR